MRTGLFIENYSLLDAEIL